MLTGRTLLVGCPFGANWASDAEAAESATLALFAGAGVPGGPVSSSEPAALRLDAARFGGMG
jgi:hypothetical protein